MKLLISLTVLILLVSACTDFSGSSNAKNKDLGIDVVYGEDNRIDWYQESDLQWQSLALSTAALFDKDDLLPGNDDEHYKLKTVPYGLSKQLCLDEPFYNQNRGAFCSSFLIAPDLMVTAGHCFRNQLGCENNRFVFDFYHATAALSPNEVPKKSVYSCKELIHSQANALTGSDFALIRLDRPVVDRDPLLIRTTGELAREDELTVIGYPSGLPMKLAHEGKVRDLSAPAFIVASLDTYGGNSGSAVFNSRTRLVEGILFNGDTDFVFNPEQKCRISNACKETGCRGEDVTRISEIFPYLPPQDRF